MSFPFRQARFDYGPRRGPALAFVVHMAEGGGTVDYLAGEPARGVSVHYVVEYGGRVVQMLSLEHAAGSINPASLRTTDDANGLYGARFARAALGRWASDPNAATISCELEGFARDGPNPKQLAGLRAIRAELVDRYPGIVNLGHRDFQDYKPCPGTHVPWNEIGGHAVGEVHELRQAFRWSPTTLRVGTIRLAGDGHSYQRIDGSLSAPLSASDPAWVDRPAFGPVVLTLPIGPSPAGTVGYVVDGEAFVRAEDVTFTKADAVRLERDRVKAAAIAAIGGIE